MGTELVEEGAAEWHRCLRGGATATWSAPVSSPRLHAASALARGGLTGADLPPSPRSVIIKRSKSVKQQAAESEGDLRVMDLCQKPPALRTYEEIRFIQVYLSGLSYFFSLWPEPLQWELCRLVGAHILARREVALTRGRPPDRVFFIVKGKLDVRLPMPTPGGGREETTLATLGRGHTVGEAVLLGTAVQHTTVVVSSASAVLLSLSRPDFLRAFKEVLDIRQQERLMYIRMHPLMAGLPLEDLEAASEVLGLAFFPPGVRLWPADDKSRCVAFLAEGEARVKRSSGVADGADGAEGLVRYDRNTVSVLGPGDIFGLPNSGNALLGQLRSAAAAATAAGVGAAGFGGQQQPPSTGPTGATVAAVAAAAVAAGLNPSSAAAATAAAAAALGLGAHAATTAAPTAMGQHDSAAAAVPNSPAACAQQPALAPPAAASAPGSMSAQGQGGGSGPSVVIDSFSQVKVYYIRYSDYSRLPSSVRGVLEAANAFRWSYYEGRAEGLAQMEAKRRAQFKDALLRKQVTAALRRGGDGDLISTHALEALEVAERDRRMLSQVPILSASLVNAAQQHQGTDAGGGCVGGAKRQAADARKAAALAARIGRGPATDDDSTAGMPAWALGGANAASSKATPGRDSVPDGLAAVLAAALAGKRGGGATQANGANGASASASAGGGLGGSHSRGGMWKLLEGQPGQEAEAARPGTANTLRTAASVAGSEAAVARKGQGNRAHGAAGGANGGKAVAGGGGGAAAMIAAASASMRSTQGLQPQLHRNKALLKVQAQQVAQILDSEQQMMQRLSAARAPGSPSATAAMSGTRQQQQQHQQPETMVVHGGGGGGEGVSFTHSATSSYAPQRHPHYHHHHHTHTHHQRRPGRRNCSSEEDDDEQLYCERHQYAGSNIRRDEDMDLRLPLTAASASSLSPSTSPGRRAIGGREDRRHQSHAPAAPTLSLLAPGHNAFPRVPMARDVSVETEAPRSQSVPYSVKQRHVMMFQQAQALSYKNARITVPKAGPLGAVAAPYASPSSSPHGITPGRGPSHSGLRDDLSGLPPPGRFSATSIPDQSSSTVYDAAPGFPGPAAATFSPSSARPQSGRPQRPDDKLSRYGSAGRISSGGSTRPGSASSPLPSRYVPPAMLQQQYAGAAGAAAAADGQLQLPPVGAVAARPFATAAGASPGEPTSVDQSVLLMRSPSAGRYSFLDDGRVSLTSYIGDDGGGGGEDGIHNSSSTAANDCTGGGRDDDDDAVLLARVPSALLLLQQQQHGGAGSTAGHEGGGGRALSATSTGMIGHGHNGHNGHGATTGSAVAQQQQQQQQEDGGLLNTTLRRRGGSSTSSGFMSPKPPAARSGSGSSSSSPHIGQPSPGAASAANSLPASRLSSVTELVGGTAAAAVVQSPLAPSPSAAAGTAQQQPAPSSTVRSANQTASASPRLGDPASPQEADNVGGLRPSRQGSTAAGAPHATAMLPPRSGSSSSNMVPDASAGSSSSHAQPRALGQPAYPPQHHQQQHYHQQQHHHHQHHHQPSGPHLQLPHQHHAAAAPQQAHSAAATGAAHQQPGLQHPQQQPAPSLGLDPGVALGYVSLDPFQWASAMAAAGPGVRPVGPFTQDNLLPKPQW